LPSQRSQFSGQRIDHGVALLDRRGLAHHRRTMATTAARITVHANSVRSKS
jgi:hypothetical protein